MYIRAAQQRKIRISTKVYNLLVANILLTNIYLHAFSIYVANLHFPSPK